MILALILVSLCLVDKFGYCSGLLPQNDNERPEARSRLENDPHTFELGEVLITPPLEDQSRQNPANENSYHEE